MMNFRTWNVDVRRTLFNGTVVCPVKRRQNSPKVSRTSSLKTSGVNYVYLICKSLVRMRDTFGSTRCLYHRSPEAKT